MIAQLEILLHKRANVYPVRDKNYIELQQGITTFAKLLLNKLDTTNSQPTAVILSKLAQIRYQPIFICGGMKTGTSLMVQLLDGHPNLLVMPGDSRYAQSFLNFKGNFESLAIYWLKRLINPTGKAPFWLLGKEQEKYQIFLQYLHFFYHQNKTKDVFFDVISAIYATDYLKLREVKYWVEKTPTNELQVQKLLANYPKAKFINMTRDPLDNLPSLKKMFTYKGERFNILRTSKLIKKQLQAAINNEQQLGSQYYSIVRYEDLVNQPEKHMESISEFLKIPYVEELITPTQNKELAISNTMYLENRSEGLVYNRTKEDRWKKNLTKWQKIFVVSYLFKEVKAVGYTQWQEIRINQFKFLTII